MSDDCTIHPNAPEKLVAKLRKLGWNRRALGRLRGVNIFYISQLLNKGIEPSNPDIRARLYLPRRKGPRPEHPPLPEWLKRTRRGIRKMVKETNEVVRKKES